MKWERYKELTIGYDIKTLDREEYVNEVAIAMVREGCDDIEIQKQTVIQLRHINSQGITRFESSLVTYESDGSEYLLGYIVLLVDDKGEKFFIGIDTPAGGYPYIATSVNRAHKFPDMKHVSGEITSSDTIKLMTSKNIEKLYIKPVKVL